MTEIKNAIQYGDDYYRDLISACCNISDRHKEYIKMANNSLNAWEEVLNELGNIYLDEHENQYGNGIHKAIDIINKHLVGLKYNERIRE